MKPTVCFFTVCGGGEDYEFLLGQIRHHAALGCHLVLDTTPGPEARRFAALPRGVRWVHEPVYGRGWKEFRLRSAVERAAELARECGADVLAYLDSDEFFSADAGHWLFPLARDLAVHVKTVTWLPSGPRDFGESEWHLRLWPSRMKVRIAVNDAWLSHPDYNGNPEHHPVVVPPEGARSVRACGPLHHHLHYAVGAKRGEVETARSTIDGWAEGGVPADPVPWPEPLASWRDEGVLPSLAFS